MVVHPGHACAPPSRHDPSALRLSLQLSAPSLSPLMKSDKLRWLKRSRGSKKCTSGCTSGVQEKGDGSPSGNHFFSRLTTCSAGGAARTCRVSGETTPSQVTFRSSAAPEVSVSSLVPRGPVMGTPDKSPSDSTAPARRA